MSASRLEEGQEEEEEDRGEGEAAEVTEGDEGGGGVVAVETDTRSSWRGWVGGRRRKVTWTSWSGQPRPLGILRRA